MPSPVAPRVDVSRATFARTETVAPRAFGLIAPLAETAPVLRDGFTSTPKGVVEEVLRSGTAPLAEPAGEASAVLVVRERK